MKITEHPFIQSIPEQRLEEVLEEVEVLRFERDATIFRENSPSDAIYLVLEGVVGFAKLRPDESFQHVSETPEGSFFGEVGIFTGEPRSLAAYAQTEAVVGRIPEPTVQRIFFDAAPVKKVVQSVISHLKSTTSHYMDDLLRTEKLSVVGTMVSSILHDFKNPFSIISLGAHLIEKRHASDAKTQEVCQNIEAQIRRMVNMANDLYAFARGEDAIEVAELSVAELFSNFRTLNSPFFQDDRVAIVMDDGAVHLKADQAKLFRVLQNLVSNSIEAIHLAERNGTIRIEAFKQGDAVTLRVSDDGPGIPEEIRTSLFEPFVTYGKSEGTGLGTAIAKSIVEAHGGRIDLETGTGGTTFTIRLPDT